ncbi:MAG: FUSC family protein [Thermomicrobiales bacterium]
MNTPTSAPATTQPPHPDQPSVHPARLPEVSRSIWRSLLNVDRARISVSMALRNTIGLFTPLLICIAAGKLELAMTVGFSTNTIAISDQAGPDLTKFPRLMAATTGAALATVAGNLAGGYELVLLLLLAIWSFSAGMLAVFGLGAIQVGICSTLALLFASAHPHAGFCALELGGIVFLAGTFQTLVSSAPVHLPPWLTGLRIAHPAEQKALAHALRLEARFARDPASSRGEGPGNTALVEASRLLRGQHHPAAAEIGSAVLEVCYRLQTSLLAVHRTIIDHRAGIGNRILAIQSTAMHEVSRTIELAADALDGDPLDPAVLARRLDALDRALDSLAIACDEDSAPLNTDGPHRLQLNPEERQRIWFARFRLLDRMRSLRTETTELAKLATDLRLQQRWTPNPSTIWRVTRVHLAEARTTLSANLTTDSAAFRHAIRLSTCIVSASVAAILLDLHHGYWAPMAATIILRPQFGITMSRGIGRLIGTAFGLGLGTAVMILLPSGTLATLMALIVFAFCFRLLAPSNNVLATTMISAWVVALLTLVDVPPETAIVDRGTATLLGGGIALGLFLIWPTWERGRLSVTLARMVETLGATSHAVLTELLDPGSHTPEEIRDLRMASRLARANAAASAARLAEEPNVPARAQLLASLLVGETQQLALAILSLENSLGDLARADGIDALRPPLDRARGELDRVLTWIATSLRNRGRQPVEDPSIALRQSADALQFAANHRAAMLFPAASPSAPDGDEIERRTALAAIGVGNEVQRVATIVSAMCGQVMAYREGQVPTEDDLLLQSNPAD